jgi:vacuolar-type H+-ATPase subunit I/STV1
MESTALSGNKNEDLALLKSYSERWHAVGFVPKDHVKEVMDKYNQILDVKYGQINADRAEREITAFRSRVEAIKNQGGDQAVKKEKFNLRDKLDRLQAQIKQYENNMGFFTGKGAEAMRKEIEKKIKATEREMDEVKKKLEMM